MSAQAERRSPVADSERSEEITRPAGVAVDATLRVLRVPPEAHGMRLDVFLKGALRNTSRTRAKLIAERGAYTAQGRPLRANDRLKAEQRVALWRLPVDETSDVELRVLYEDEHLLAIDKPAHIAVHPTARHYHATVTNLLADRFPGQHFSLIHRLDRETSGVLLIARSQLADSAFKRLFEGRTLAQIGAQIDAKNGAKSGDRRAIGVNIEKTYLAIAHGRLPEQLFAASVDGARPSFVIDQPLEPDGNSPLRVKMRVAKSAQEPLALTARTRVSVLAVSTDYGAEYSLLLCTLLTGRQHQIRVHLKSIGHPLVGDKLYGSDERLLVKASDGLLTSLEEAELELPRHALHALCYRLPHALTGEQLVIEAPVPDDLRDFWQAKSGTTLPVDWREHA